MEKPMNSDQPGEPDDHNRPYDSALNGSASKLDVYRHERLAYTEPPVRASAARSIRKQTLAVLDAMYHWLLSLLTRIFIVL
jgi:hypothetical protein